MQINLRRQGWMIPTSGPLLVIDGKSYTYDDIIGCGSPGDAARLGIDPLRLASFSGQYRGTEFLDWLCREASI